MLRSEQPSSWSGRLAHIHLFPFVDRAPIPGGIQPFSGDVSTKYSALLLTVASVFGFMVPVLAQDSNFNLTYHVERTPKAKLSIETRGSTIEKTAEQSGLASNVQTFPGQLVVVRGGDEGRGAFIAQCIEVESTTVSVVQGIDYQGPKAALGKFADQANAAVKAAAE